jgi:hypothetical protein
MVLGVPVPRNEFDTMVVDMNKTTLTVTAKVLPLSLVP